MLYLFERLGLTYTRPTYTLDKVDPQKQEEVRKAFESLGKHEGVKLVGIRDYETGHVYVEEHKKYDAEVFPQFLKNVLSQYQDGKIVIILDNAKIHHAKLLRKFLAENRERLELVFLPPYSPSLNKD